MKVLLIYPQFPNTYWSFRHALALEGKQAAFPPLGLLTVSALLPNSWERRLVDLNVQPLLPSAVAWAEMVFVSAMIVQKESLAEVVRVCRALGKKVVVGGPYAATVAEQMPEADHIFIGESETTLPEFVRDLAAGCARRVYQSAERPALTATPTPHFHLADLKSYSAMSVQYSRGCPFQCEFCDIIEIYGRVPRTKTSAQMLAELEALLQVGWRGQVFIVDDNFIGNKRQVKQFLPELIAWSQQHGFPFSFITEASINLAEDAELLELMQRANFRRVFLGIETPVAESLQAARKTQNTRSNLLESVQKIQSYGLEVMAGFIVGFDNDPEDIFERQINFIHDSAIPLAMVGLLTALPRTQLWRRLEREGRLAQESSGNNTDGSLNFIPKMDKTSLLEGYRRIMHTIYSPATYYRRALECLARIRPNPMPRNRRLSEDARALWRVIYTLGLRDSKRWHFWRYMGRVIASHRDHFGHAMTLAAMGYHFRKLASD